MARYEENDDRSRDWGDDEDEADERPRRRDDYRPSRRATLMQQRLRRARGEEAADDDYDDDDYDDYPRSRHARSREYDRPYGGGGSGCSASVLYLVLAAVAVFVVLVLIGREFIGGLGGLGMNVPQQIREVVATPTPTIRDRGGTIQQIRSLNRLETQSYSVERIIEASVERGNILDTFLGDRLLLIASGTVVAGVDLSKLGEDDVTLSADGEQITLRLPPAEIFSNTLDNNRTRVYDRQTGIFANQQQDLETQARQEAENEILKAACEGGIMQKAADEAKQSMEQFLGLLEFESVTVVTSAGPCAASPTVPTQPTTTTP
jgi:hypothetical protein